MADLREIALNVVRVTVARALENGATRQDIDRVIDEASRFHQQRGQRATKTATKPSGGES